jgi:hypothetical protein
MRLPGTSRYLGKFCIDSDEICHFLSCAKRSHYRQACNFLHALVIKVATMFVEIQGAKIYFADSGKGVPTLFLHGIPDSGSYGTRSPGS